MVVALMVVGYRLYHQAVSGLPVGDTLALLIPVGVLALLWSAKLEAQVRPDDLYVRYWPFHRSYQRIRLAHVIDVQSKTYSPLKEYGGWGIRFARGGRKAYNVRGNRGVLLKFANGKSLLVGSQEPDELERAIRSVWQGGGHASPTPSSAERW